MLTIDDRPAHCLVCGSTELTDTGYDHLFRFVAMSRFSCVCGARLELHDIVTLQADAIEKARKARTVGPRVRTTDPEPSHIAAQLPLADRQEQVIAALKELGRADADQVTAWVNARFAETQRSATSKRLGELEGADGLEGIVAKDGTHINHRGRTVTVYRLTEQARRQAA